MLGAVAKLHPFLIWPNYWHTQLDPFPDWWSDLPSAFEQIHCCLLSELGRCPWRHVSSSSMSGQNSRSFGTDSHLFPLSAVSIWNYYGSSFIYERACSFPQWHAPPDFLSPGFPQLRPYSCHWKRLLSCSFLSSFSYFSWFNSHSYEAKYHWYLQALVRHCHWMGQLFFGGYVHSIACGQRPDGTWMCSYFPQKRALWSGCTFIIYNYEFENLVCLPHFA